MNILKKACAGTLALVFGITSIVPSMAAPMNLERPALNQNVEQVRDDRRPPRGHAQRHKRPPSNAHRPGRPPHHANRPGRPPHSSHRPSNRPGYWHGHHGSRYYRNGYRRHSDGWWYPLAAFTAGAIVGGALNQPRVVHTNNHVRWCQNRYRTYRVSDNTFQPNSGPRRQCVSPYR
ncbi:lectin [Ochrobactrum sp. P6BS-III]|jgi:hypothetical protein|uniref:BA14K family protein n=1 Tax=unclassified Ochrobactrum TaxID=239106 RepID=UPI000991B1A2|nr:hypothetical protein [Ochrobactrum sp. P6BSIII]OOL20382.1 lectin [Ochrobactrum sp. P6BS-III]